MPRLGSLRLGSLAWVGLGLLIACSQASTPAPPSSSAPPASPQAQTTPSLQATQPGHAGESTTLLQCDPQQLGFPLPSDTRNCRHLDVITNFQTELSPEQVIEFYRADLEQKGWTRDDDGGLRGVGFWVSGPKRLHVITTAGNPTSVQIQATGK